MMLDLIVGVLVLLGGVFGARAGAAKQIASWGGLVLGAILARPGASLFGPTFAGALHTSAILGSVAAGFATFIVVAVAVRWVGASILRGLLAGRDPQERGADRALGFVLGAGKVLAIAWVALSALAFVEENVQVAGKGVGFSPRDSTAFAAARKWNLFAAPVFSEARDLVKAQEIFHSPELFGRVAHEPAVAALQKNPRFRAVFADPDVKKALENGDTVALLKCSSVHKLLQDSEALGQLASLRSALERSEKKPLPK
jgi:membrane protein required for colicin V production